MKKSIRAAAVAVAAMVATVLGSVAVPTSAQAAQSNCKDYRYGRLCAYAYANGYLAYMTRGAGGPSYANMRFSLHCTSGYTAQDHGAFSTSPYLDYSFFFSVGNRGLCEVQLTYFTGGEVYYSGLVAA